MKVVDYSFGASSPRSITVVQGYPLYKSTGRSENRKKYPETWLPFISVCTQSYLQITKGMLIKAHPFFDQRNFEPDLFYPNDVIEKFSDDLYFLFRAGNLESLCISASIGGGIWERRAADRFYLKDTYGHLLDDEIKLEESSEEIDTIREINNWLKEQGSIMKALGGYETMLYRFPENTHITPRTKESSPSLLFYNHFISKSAGENDENKTPQSECCCLIM